jgi:hypothetical protein
VVRGKISILSSLMTSTTLFLALIFTCEWASNVIQSKTTLTEWIDGKSEQFVKNKQDNCDWVYLACHFLIFLLTGNQDCQGE